MIVKFDSNDELPLNKTMEIYNVTIVVRSTFHENNKYYPQVFLDECLYKIQKWKVKIDEKKLILKNVCVIILMI